MEHARHRPMILATHPEYFDRALSNRLTFAIVQSQTGCN
jgi:hypothetical protein